MISCLLLSKQLYYFLLLPDCLFGGSVLLITNEVVGGDHRGDPLVGPHVDGVDVGVAVEATGDEVDGGVLHLVSSLGDGSVPGCDVEVISSPSCSFGHSASSSITSS